MSVTPTIPEDRDWLDALLPQSDEPMTPTARGRARTLVMTAFAAVAGTSASAVAALFGVPGFPLWMLLLTIASIGTVPVLFRATGNYRLSAWSLVVLIVVLGTAFVVQLGGLSSAAVLWLPLVPSTALLLLDRRASFAALAYITGLVAVLLALHIRGVLPGSDGLIVEYRSAFAIVTCTVVFLATGQVREVALQMAQDDRGNQTRALARAEAASRAKSSILASVSHELRTPMTGILGLADLLSETQLDARQSDWVRTIHRTGNALLALLDDLLDSARLDAGNLTLKERPFRPLDLAEQVVALFQPRARSKRLALHLELSPDTPVKVLGDAARIRQILINLVGNAVKFTRQGGVILRVQPHPNGSLLLQVTDSGGGIPADRLEDVFTAFVRAENDHTTTAGGVGLGLSIARLLVEAMGGKITVESELDVGSTFSVLLPLEVVDADAPTTDQSILRTSGGSLRVLVAEDNPVNRMVITAMLESMGHEVRAAHNGDEVVPMARAFHPDVVLMDMRMPVVDGLEATRRLRGDPRFDELKVIALTANAFDEDRRACLEAGMDAFLAKPVTREQLRAALEAPLEIFASV